MNTESNLSLKQFELHMKREADEALASLQKKYQLEVASANRTADAERARDERIRNEIVHWSNPILESVRDLRYRLKNILRDDAYPALHRQPSHPIPDKWSITYSYFMPSTLYLFACYFYWVNRFQTQLSFELFHSQSDMDVMLGRLQAVRHRLGMWPLEPACSGKDTQVFSLQQREIGEALTVRSDNSERPMAINEFMLKWEKQPLALHLAPLHALVHELENDGTCRWRRLEGVLEELEKLEAHCRSVLQPNTPAAAPTNIAENKA